MLILSPRAVERLESYTPPWPMPKIFRLTKAGKLIAGIFEGETINTPSMLCVEDYIDALEMGRVASAALKGFVARADANLAVLAPSGSTRSNWVDFLCADPAARSNTSICLKIVDPRVAALDETSQRAFVKKMEAVLEAEAAAFDIGGYRDAPPGLRIWCGATIDRADIEALTPWLDWAFGEAKAAIL